MAFIFRLPYRPLYALTSSSYYHTPHPPHPPTFHYHKLLKLPVICFLLRKSTSLFQHRTCRMQTSNQGTLCWYFFWNERSRNFRCCGMFDDIAEETPGQLMTSNPPCIWDQEGGGKNTEQARQTVCRIHTPSARKELLRSGRNQQCVRTSVYLTTVYQQQQSKMSV